jgi:hypothetical protein
LNKESIKEIKKTEYWIGFMLYQIKKNDEPELGYKTYLDLAKESLDKAIELERSEE